MYRPISIPARIAAPGFKCNPSTDGVNSEAAIIINYEDKKAYLTLISDAYITLSLKDNCDFAITSEISYQNLQNQKHAFKHNEFKKSDKVYLYEKGSVIINPSQALIDDLNNKNLQQIGYNIFTKGKN